VKNKKGQIVQVIFLFVVIFIVGITAVFGKYVLDSVYDAMEEAELTTQAGNESKAIMEAQYLTFDYALLTLTIIMIIGMIITSFMIPTHPIFMVINILGIFILIFMGMIMTNVYSELVSGEGADYLGDTADDFELTNFLLSYLPFIGAIVIFIVSVVTYSRATT